MLVTSCINRASRLRYRIKKKTVTVWPPIYYKSRYAELYVDRRNSTHMYAHAVDSDTHESIQVDYSFSDVNGAEQAPWARPDNTLVCSQPFLSDRYRGLICAVLTRWYSNYLRKCKALQRLIPISVFPIDLAPTKCFERRPLQSTRGLRRKLSHLVAMYNKQKDYTKSIILSSINIFSTFEYVNC